MISDIVLNFVHSIVLWILGGILAQPDVSAANGFQNAMADLYSLIAAFGNLLPSQKIFLATSFIVVLEVAIMGYKAIMFVIKKIPGIN